MNLARVMDQVAERLDSISGLRTYAYPLDAPPAPPAAVVSYPDEYNYDSTYGRGMDRLTLPVVVVVGRVPDRATRDLLAQYVDGDGPRSFKRVLEAVELPPYTAFDSLRVVSVEFDVVTRGGVDLMAAMFDLDIAGSGTT